MIDPLNKPTLERHLGEYAWNGTFKNIHVENLSEKDVEIFNKWIVRSIPFFTKDEFNDYTLEITPEIVHVRVGQEFGVQVLGNDQWSIILDDADYPIWLEPSITSGAAPSQVRFKVSGEGDKDSGLVIFQGYHNTSAVLLVIRDSSQVTIDIDPNEWLVGIDGGQKDFMVKAYPPGWTYEVDPPEAEGDWVTVIKVDETRLRVLIGQTEEKFINVPSEQPISAKGSSSATPSKIKVKSNIENWNFIAEDCDWITSWRKVVTESEEYVEFIVKENIKTEPRSIKVEFYDVDGVYVERPVCQVVQSAAGMEIDIESYYGTVPVEGTGSNPISLKVTTNDPKGYTVSVDEESKDWAEASKDPSDSSKVIVKIKPAE